MKTLAQILAENADKIIKAAEAINKLIKDAEDQGVEFPVLDEVNTYGDVELT